MSERPLAEKPFLDHLEDLRWTLIGITASVAVGILVALPFAPWLLRVIQEPLTSVTGSSEPFLRSLEVGGAFSMTLRLAGWGGLVLSSPLVLVFIGRFVFPGLFEHEKRIAVKAVIAGVLLFIAGLALGYSYALPTMIRMMWQLHAWLGIRVEWTIQSYLAFAMPLLIGFGLVFETPIVLVVLGRLGLISSRQLRQRRRHAIVAALVIGMIMTPPDVFSQLLMAVPLIALYEISIWLIRGYERMAATRS